MNYTTTLLVFLALLVGVIMSGQRSERIEVETGRNTLEMRQAIERERLATDEQMQRRRIEAEAARQYEYIQGEMKQQQQAQFLSARANLARPVAGAGLSLPLAARGRAEHEFAQSRPVFLLLPRSQSRGVSGTKHHRRRTPRPQEEAAVVEPRRSTANEKAVDLPSPPQYVDPPSPPKYLKNVRPLEGLQRDRPARPTEGRASERPSDFSRLSESVKDLPPKEQVSRVRQHFGILGGARPAVGRGRRAKNAGTLRAWIRSRRA